MAEYIERDKLLNDFELCNKQNPRWTPQRVKSLLLRASAIDAVERVRCLECKHTREKNEYEKNYIVEDVLICTSPDVSDDCWSAVWPDHFCSYGVRKDGDDYG